MKCYICPNETMVHHILVRLEEAEDDSKMYHNDYHPIIICDSCYQKIQERITIEQKKAWEEHHKWCQEHPVEAYTLAQTVIDSFHSSQNNGLVVRDILPENQ